MINFKEIEQSINENSWFSFGSKKFECLGERGLKEVGLPYYMENNELPSPCDECYKALIFWSNSYSEQNLTNFFDMIKSFEFEYKGKFNRETVVFYFRDKNEMLDFLEYLKNKMQEYNVKGKPEWRRACKEYQNSKPQLWKNAKEFIPDLTDKKLTDFSK